MQTYAALTFLPSELRSYYNHVYLTLLSESQYETNFGYVAVFNILIEKMNYLKETRIKITLEKGVKVTLYTLSAYWFSDII